MDNKSISHIIENAKSFSNIKRDGVGQTTILKFLEEHPEEAEPFYSQKKIVSMDTISAFLNWPKSRVSYSLERLKMIGQLIQDGQRRGEIARKDDGYVGNQWGVPNGNTPKTLSDIGISRKESSTLYLHTKLYADTTK